VKHCPKCNRSYDDHETFCGYDGGQLVSDAASPSPPANTPIRTEAPRVANSPAAAEPFERIVCEWCTAQNQKGALSCRSCGAPLDVSNLVSESGWREAPRIRDMTEIHFGTSTCQVEGEIVPVA